MSNLAAISDPIAMHDGHCYVRGHRVAFSPAQERAFRCLAAAMPHRAPKPALRAALCPATKRDREVSDNVLRVQLCCMRKKLKPFGLMISGVYNQGYLLWWRP